MDKTIEKKKWNLKNIALLVLLPATIIFFVFGFLADTKTKKLNVEKDKLTIEPVTSGAFEEFIPLDGTVLPIKTVYLDAIEGGRVEKRFVEDGTMVEEGQPILKLSSSQLELDLMNREELLSSEKTAYKNSIYSKDKNLITLKEQLEELEYNLKRAKRTYTQDSALVKDKVVSENEYKQAKDEYEYLSRKQALLKLKIEKEEVNGNAQIAQYASSVNVKEKNLMIASDNYDKLIIKAPVKGQLTALKGEVGELKTKGQNVGQIDVLDGYKVKASIDEHYITRVSVGQYAEFDLSGKTYKLSVKKIFPQVNNGKFEADLEFEKDVPSEIRRGQTLQLKLKLGGNTTAVLIPRGGFYQNTGGNWIFVMDKSGAYAIKRNIKIGRQNPENFEVLEGLKPGESVITSGYETFGETEKLILKE